MKKITSQKLSKRLAKYGALSVAIAGVADASGQIVHTPNVDFVGTLLSSLVIDFDGDTVDDVVVLQTNFPAGSIYIELMRAEAFASNGIAANVVGNYTYGVNVPYGSAIGASTTVASFGDMCQAAGYTNSQFCGTTGDGYIGVSFDISGSTHYGWVRIAPGSSSTNFTVLDYAYESSPDTSINAGQTLGIEDNELNKIKIVALNKSIALFNLPQSTNYRLFSITGKSVLDGKISNNTHVIEANTLATGVYIIELEDADANAVIRKKIVL